ALLQLEREGLVVIVPFKGARVAGISLKDIREVFELRAALEGLAARLATSVLTEKGLEEARRVLLSIDEAAGNEDYEAYAAAEKQIHRLLARASDNDRLVASLKNLDDQVERMRALAIHGPGRLTRSRQEYRAILAAIEEGNPSQAEKLMRAHVHAVMQELLEEQSRLEKQEVEAFS
ncbi:MAG: GntR family transcriptional regulator, partial [Chloroflexi bacterium]|nr:GntR family transcriptional regulator [Chloroflexota bacterium]